MRRRARVDLHEMTSEPSDAPYFVAITSWPWMTSGLLLMVVDRHDGDLEHAAESLGLSEVDTRERVETARARNLPSLKSKARLEVTPDRWEVMVGHMVLEVVELAPSLPAAAFMLGISSTQLRRLVIQAKRLVE